MRLLVAALVCAATADAGALRDERRSKVFCAAVRRGNARAVKMSIRKGVDIEYQCPAANGTETALCIASREGHADIVDALLREGAAVTIALHIAAGYGQTEVAELLLGAGGNPWQGDVAGYTPLDNAARWGHQKIVEEFLDEASVDVKSHDAKGAPIYWAAQYGRVEVIKLLLERGADPNIGARAGTHPLYIAAENNHSDVVRALLEVVDPRGATWNSYSPLHVAADAGSTASLEVLVEDGRLSVNDRTVNGTTPLFLATRRGQLDVVEKLLEHGANASIAMHSGVAPLYAAAELDRSDVVRRLLEVVDPRRSTLKQSAWRGFSCLHLAAVEGSTAALEILLADGRLPIDSRNIVAPLWVAAEHGQLESVKILLGHGADVWSRAKLQSGWFSPAYTSAEIAAKNGHHEVAALIRTHQPWSTEVKLCATVACMLIAALIMSELSEAARALEALRAHVQTGRFAGVARARRQLQRRNGSKNELFTI